MVRELGEHWGLGELVEEHLTDSRASNTRFPFAGLMWRPVHIRLAGYEDVNDAKPLP